MNDVTIRKKAMILQPTNGLTDEEIEKTRNKAIKHLERLGYKVVYNLFTDDWYSESSLKDRGVVNIPLFFLAKSIEKMSHCDVAYFCDGWEDDRGCRIEHETAEEYELDIIYAEDTLEGMCEELSELQAALLKCYNKGPGEGRIEAVQEEIADVYIMLEQIRKQFMSREELDDWIDYKITREAERGNLA